MCLLPSYYLEPASREAFTGPSYLPWPLECPAQSEEHSKVSLSWAELHSTVTESPETLVSKSPLALGPRRELFLVSLLFLR